MTGASGIRDIHLRKIYDSRGNPTVEAEIRIENGTMGRAASPSGASTGRHEVRAFPEGGVDAAIAHFLERGRPRLLGSPVDDQAAFDGHLKELDGTPDLSYFGGNTCTALSVALSRALAASRGVPLWKAIPQSAGHPSRPPALVGNVMNGGVHAVGGPDIQEYIAYVEAPTARAEVEAVVAVHRAVGRRLRTRFPKAALGRGDEGGWVAPLGNVEALEILGESCAEVRDERRSQGVSVRPGLDLAASEFYQDGRYRYKDQTLDPQGQLGFVLHLVDRYGLAYVEDPFDQDDMDHFAALTAQLSPGDALVVGDDLYTTNPRRVEEGIPRRATNAVLIKVNQVGTLTDTLETVSRTRAAGWKTVTSHRSGEVPDAWLPHLAIAFGSRGLKCGVLGGERIAKLNELVRVAEAET